MEIITKNSVPAKLEFNFEEVKEFLQEKMEEYKGLVVTEENKKEMKDTLAELNKTAKNIEDYRKEQKKILSEPLKIFEEKCKELVALVEDVSLPIKEQLNVFEEERKKEKELKIKDFIKEIVEKFELSVYKERLTIDEKYLNKTTKDKDVIADLENRATQIKQQEEIYFAAKKLKNQKLDLIQKEVEENNNKYGINLRISNFQYLSSEEYEIVDIPKIIKEEAEKFKNEMLEKEKQLSKTVKVPKTESKKVEEKFYSFSLYIGECSLKKANLLKEFLEKNNYEFKLSENK